jgi:hypothetical protein
MLSLLVALAMTAPAHFEPHRTGDAQPLHDPMRPVTSITKDSFTLQYFTSQPCETRVQYRQDDVPMTAWRPADASERNIDWQTDWIPGKRTWHTITIRNLQPGKRYFYRIWDPGADPTRQEREWGAGEGWRREFAVATQAPKGYKTIIHLPIKVLLMPNVINVASAHGESGAIAPEPPRMTESEIQKIKDEFHVASRYFWVNSGMRLWVDFQFFVDDRWQRWGEEPAEAAEFYRGWPASRSWAGQDYVGPGGGAFTYLDTKNPLRVLNEPVFEERPYSGQVEMAWTRRWNPKTEQWEFYNSGGGTYGVDGFPRGQIGRSQYLGGGDAAWLTAHEVHHQLESKGSFSLSNREDERVVFNHYEARRRVAKPDGAYEENTWATSGRHGEHWSGMAYWDRKLSDAQWLRFYFGYAVVVRDGDEDGFPDDDPRLPLDERRFGSDPRNPQTDGRIGDLAKAMLSTWTPAPLQSSWIKPEFQAFRPNPREEDSDGDGIPDDLDPYPLYPWPPFIYPMTPDIDGAGFEWGGIPLSGEMQRGNMIVTFQQAHDEAGYYGLLTMDGPWQRISCVFDGEGHGVYSGVGVQGFDVIRSGDKIEVRPTFGKAPGLTWAAKEVNGVTAFEFRFPNRGEGIWFWTRGGREIGASIHAFDQQGRGFSMYEPYELFYARMLEPHGKPPLPPNPPAELATGEGVVALLPDDPRIKLSGNGWQQEDGLLRHSGGAEGAAVIDGLSAREFDLWVKLEARQDAILGAFVRGTPEMNAGRDYIAFVGGYGNTVTKIRLFGREVGEDGSVMAPGIHTVQLSRREGGVWLLLNGKPIIWSPDPNPDAVVDRLGALGGYNGQQVIHEIRYRIVR